MTTEQLWILLAFVVGLMPWLVMQWGMRHAKHCRSCKKRLIKELLEHDELFVTCGVKK